MYTYMYVNLFMFRVIKLNTKFVVSVYSNVYLYIKLDQINSIYVTFFKKILNSCIRSSLCIKIIKYNSIQNNTKAILIQAYIK